MKGVVLVCLLVTVAIAEPPVDNRYLPPAAGSPGYRTTNQDRFSPPTEAYVTPQRQTDAVIRPRPSSNYIPPRSSARRPASLYGAPSNGPASQFGAPRQGPPSAEYGAPLAAQQQTTASFGGPSQQYGPPSQQYGAPSSFGGSRQSGGGSGPSGAPAPVYGAPGGNGRGNGYAGDEDGNGEPANYSFEYMVKDDESGNDFGHRESRMGDRTEGLYYVLLPDGRKQINPFQFYKTFLKHPTVEYEADSNGYRPKISYEDTGAARGGGYDANSQDGGRNGYQNGGNGYQDGSGPY